MTERARNRTGGIVPVDAVAFWKKKRIRPGFDYAAVIGNMNAPHPPKMV